MSTVLPNWLNKHIPAVVGCGLLGYDEIEDIFWIKEKDSTSLNFYNSMADVMEDFVNGNTCNLSIDKSVSARYRIMHSCLVNSTGTEIFVINNNASQLESLERDFREWQGFYRDVAENENWKSAYHLIETFPILWEPVATVPTLLWNRNDGHNFLDQAVIDDSVILDLYIPDRDLSINVAEESFEQAYLSLGKAIVKGFSVEDCSVKDSSVLS